MKHERSDLIFVRGANTTSNQQETVKNVDALCE